METAIPPQSTGPPGPLTAPERPQDAGSDPASRWKPWTAFVALIVAVGASLVAFFVVAVVASILGLSLSHSTGTENLIATFAQDLCFAGAAVWLAARVAFPRPDQFGLRPTAVGRAVGLVVGGYLLFLLISAVWIKALNLHQTDRLPKMLGAQESHLALVMVAVLTCVVAPICEEFLFRGYMFRALRNWRGVWPAALIVGLIFGAVHVASAPIGFLLPLAVFGVILCLVYEIAASLYPCIALHCVNNSIAFASIEHAHAGVWLALLVAALATIAATLTVVVRRWSAMQPVEPAR